MHFTQENDNPTDAICHVCDVLAFLSDALCWPLDKQVELSGQGINGLNLILMACENSLKKAIES